MTHQSLPPDITNDERLDRLVKLPRVKRYLARRYSLDREHHIPYLAGYSVDGKTIYIDKRLPAAFDYGGRNTPIDRFIILHEHIEKTLLDALGWVYLAAHRIAIVAERRAVIAAGVNWADYDRFIQEWIAKIKDAPFRDIPIELDLEPYRANHRLISEIRATQNRKPRRRET